MCNKKLCPECGKPMKFLYKTHGLYRFTFFECINPIKHCFSRFRDYECYCN